MKKNDNRWKLGMFVILGLTMFLVTIYFIGKSQNLFGSTFRLEAQFKNVSGLKVGNNVALSGIDIGTIKDISFISDSAVVVGMIIRSDIQKFIKADAFANIGNDGLMGDKILMISPGSSSSEIVKDGALIDSKEAVGIEDLMVGLKKSFDNAEIITKELAEFSVKINSNKGAVSKILTDEEFAKSIDVSMQNLKTTSAGFVTFTNKMNDKDGTLSKLMTDPYYTNSIKKSLSGLETSVSDINIFTGKLNEGNGILPRLISDEKLANTLDTTMINLQQGSEKLLEIEEAAKHNFLLRGYFKKQKKAEEKKKKELEQAQTK